MNRLERLVEEIRNRQKMRMDALEDDGRWITTKKGHHVHLNENDEPDAGNEHVLEAMVKGKKVADTPKNLMESIREIIADAYKKVEGKSEEDKWEGGLEEGTKKVRDILDGLPEGSKIGLPADWADDGKSEILEKIDGRWYNKKWKITYPADELAGYFINAEDDKSQLPQIKSVARSAESKGAAAEKRVAEYWRNNEHIWYEGESLDKKMTIKMDGPDIDNIGNGYSVIGTDGKRYTKYDGDWFDDDYRPLKDRRKISRGKIEGDVFDINCGMNGVPKESCDRVREIFNGMDESVKKEYEHVLRNCRFEKSDRGSHYNSGKIMFNQYADEETVIHEMAHAIADNYKVCREMDDRAGMHEFGEHGDFDAMCKELGIETNGDGWFSPNESVESKVDKFLSWHRDKMNVPGIDNVCDVISALSHNTCGETIYGGHDMSYWEQGFNGIVPSKRSEEFWAEYVTLRINGYDEALGIMKRIAPKMYGVTEQIYEEMFG